MRKIRRKHLKISIIVPVHNIEKYLKECILSIVNQSYKEYEIILVDDGSTDLSGEICDELKKKYNNINVIHKKNGGAASARNMGIASAKGEYIFCMDGDDFLKDEKFLEKIADKLAKNKVDFLQFPYLTCAESGNNISENDMELRINENDQLTYEEKIKNMIGTKWFTISPWSKVIRTAFLRENNIVFEEGMCVEDIDWSFEILDKAKSVGILESAGYVYRKRETSTSRRMSEKQIRDYISILEKWQSYLTTYDSALREAYLGYLAYEFYICLGMIYCAKGISGKKEFYIRMKRIDNITDYSINLKTRVCKVIYKIFGLHVASVIMGKYIKSK